MENKAKTQQEIEREMLEVNEQFAEFLHTKGIQAKYRLVIENIKKGAKAAPANTAAQIAKVQAETQAAVARANAMGKPAPAVTEVSAATLENEFNAFLKSKGLDGKYTVSVTEEYDWQAKRHFAVSLFVVRNKVIPFPVLFVGNYTGKFINLKFLILW